MEKTNNLTAFKRVWVYVWPQWPRVVSVVLWSFVISVMFTLSFMTVLPMLKVMMSSEGLHGWADRKTVEWRYGLKLAVPDFTDLSDKGQKDQYALRIVAVDEDSLAHTVGLERYDRIISIHGNVSDQVPYFELLAEMALSKVQDESRTLGIVYTRVIDGNQKKQLAELPIATKEQAEGQSFLDRLSWWGKWQASKTSIRLMAYLPRDADKARSIIFIIIGMGIVTILRAMARFYQTYLTDKIVFTATTHIREEVFSHSMYMPVGFFSSKGTSDTTSRILNDVTDCGRGVKVLLGKTLREPMKAMGTLTAAMCINWQLTLIFIGAAPITIAVFGVLGKKIKKAKKKSLVSSAQMLNRIQESMNALRVVKVYNRQDHEIQRYHETNYTMLRRLLRVAKIDRMANPLMEVLGMFAASGALIAGAVWMSQERIEPEGFLTLLIMLGTSAESLRKVSDVWNKVQASNAAAERVFEVLDAPEEIQEPDAFELQPLRNNIKFNDIVFTYPGATTPALKGLDLCVEAGQTVAVVGPNGSGKSTLVNLIPRFYDPDSGQICFDGQDVHQATLKSLRSQISMVTQNVITFNDTITSNIAYGKPGATTDEVIAAAQSAFADEFITPLPDGYDTLIGENSAGFSGGQLQRIVIARAILKNPQILIFDEAMSQIDADSEMKIHNALSELMKGRTCFLIAHRFSTVISADSIVVIDDGRIVAQGTHDELITCSDVYKRLYETQLMGT